MFTAGAVSTLVVRGLEELTKVQNGSSQDLFPSGRFDRSAESDR